MFLLHVAGLRVMLNGLQVASSGDVVITDIGENTDALLCMTDQTDCCNVPSNKRGEWRFPDNSLVRNNFFRTRATQLVLLNRRNNALGPLGTYCCEVDTIADPNARICVNIGSLLTTFLYLLS